jgi:hypothetical protein
VSQYRSDGTLKGPGFLGVLKRPDGNVSTELSIGVGLDGQETQIPTLVPTLTPEEVEWLLNMPPDFPASQIPEEIQDKAVAHAIDRIRQGVSPFLEPLPAARNYGIQGVLSQHFSR